MSTSRFMSEQEVHTSVIVKFVSLDGVKLVKILGWLTAQFGEKHFQVYKSTTSTTIFWRLKVSAKWDPYTPTVKKHQWNKYSCDT